MTASPRVLVYIACSLDGFIAGTDDDLSWLEHNDGEDAVIDDGAVQFAQFMSGVGSLLMGRRTYDVVAGMGVELPYGEVPILVATNREIEKPWPTVQPVRGTISEMIEQALQVAEGKHVYLDGGNLIRQALDAGLVDDLYITVVPTLLGEGVPLFAGVTERHSLVFSGHYRYGHMVQLHAYPAGRRGRERSELE